MSSSVGTLETEKGMEGYLPIEWKKAPNDTRKSKALYLMNKITVKNWEFTQGYRRERVNYDYTSKVYGPVWNLLEANPVSSTSSNNNSFELGVNYLYSDSGNLYFNYTNSMRTPSIGDMEAWTGDVKTKKTVFMNWDGEIILRTLFSRLLFSGWILEMKYITIKRDCIKSKQEILMGKQEEGSSNLLDSLFG